MSRLFIEHLDDMEAVFRLHDVGDSTLGRAESRLLKCRYGLALRKPSQVAAFVLGLLIFRVFLRQILELAAFFQFLQHFLGAVLHFRNFRPGVLAGREEQNVLDVNPVRNLKLRFAVLIKLLQLVVGDHGRGLNLVHIEQCVAN